MSWDQSAACSGLDPEVFLVTQRGRALLGVVEFCGSCPVKAPCLADGWWDDFAVRGGMGPRERRCLARYLDLVAARRVAATG